MKKIITTIFTLAIFVAGKAQTVSTFEEIKLNPNSFYKGKDSTNRWIKSGNAAFYNSYDTAFGGIWSGFSVSDMYDDSTSGFSNQFSSFAGKAKSDSNFLVGYYSAYSPTPKIKLTGNAKSATGFWITNNTYAALDMKHGSSFSKKFGGATGTDSDYLAIKIFGYKNGSMKNNFVTFLLSDYTMKDSLKATIVKQWQWVDLTSLGNIDSLQFGFSSSDSGSFGINTPTYFCIDDFTTDEQTGIENIMENSLYFYPNPANEFIYMSIVPKRKNIYIYDMKGIQLTDESIDFTGNSLNIKNMQNGIYIMKIVDNEKIYTGKFIKQ